MTKRKPNLPETLSEAAILRQILDYLTLRRVFHFRNNSGAMVSEHNGKKRFMRFGMPGSADIIGILSPKRFLQFDGSYRTDEGGQFWAIEVKAAKGKLSPAQESFRDAVIANGGKYTLARSVEDVEKALNS